MTSFPARTCDSDVVCPSIATPGGSSPTKPLKTIGELAAHSQAFSTVQIVELILKDRRGLHVLLRTTPRKMDFASRLLAISLASFALFGLAMTLTFDAAGSWPDINPIAQWLNAPSSQLLTFVPLTGDGPFQRAFSVGPATRFTAAYTVGLIATSGVCLPSLYFYALLSGLRMSMVDVVLHTLKGTAVSALALIGILPLYAAVALGALVFRLPDETVYVALFGGLCLPFVAGLWGTRSLYLGFVDFCATMPETFQAKRACFLRRLVFSWCACYTAIAPVMIVTLWQALGR